MSIVERHRAPHPREVLSRVTKLAAAIQEARRQRARPNLVVGCPGAPAAHVITVHSRFGPMCSACGAVIDRSSSHLVIEARPSEQLDAIRNELEAIATEVEGGPLPARGERPALKS